MYEWVPYMPSDMQWFVKEFAGIVKELVDYIQQRRHNYSARSVDDDVIIMSSRLNYTLNISQQLYNCQTHKGMGSHCRLVSRRYCKSVCLCEVEVIWQVCPLLDTLWKLRWLCLIDVIVYLL